MRWIPLLLIPSIASAAGLTGIWSAKLQADQGGFNRVVIVDAAKQIYFHYESDYGRRCEVFGIAKRQSSSGDLFVFENDSEHHFYEGYEGYGFEEHKDCKVSFEYDGSMLKVRATGNCNSFCGIGAGIGGELYKVPDENLTIRSGAQAR